MKYDLILADPPWRYGFSRSKSRKIENQYPTMTIPQMCRLDIAALANRDCILVMWTTAPKLEQAFTVINAWGFKYVTGGIWDKLRKGMGYYFRVRHEHILIAKRGKPRVPKPHSRVDSVLRVKRSTKHSRKPKKLQTVLEIMYPNARKIELFARKQRPGWDVWGNEVRHAITIRDKRPRKSSQPHRQHDNTQRRSNRRTSNVARQRPRTAGSRRKRAAQ